VQHRNSVDTNSSTEVLRDEISGTARVGSPVNRQRGWRPLHYGAMSGSEDAVRLLLAARADPTAKDRQGWTNKNHSKFAKFALKFIF